MIPVALPASNRTIRSLASMGLLAAFLTAAPGIALGQRADTQVSLQTRAERSGFLETSSYADVEAFTDAVTSSSSRIHKTYFGYTQEGRPLPLLVFGKVAGATPAEVLAAGGTRVFVQANIHAGEVCGKEAMLMLLRDLSVGRFARWADSLVVLVAPIYNADGNERVLLTNRGLQNGPTGGMGQRPNAMGLDLNRDHMKLDSPEARSLVGLFDDYDPHVIVDLHTTNGTHHGYHVTYAPPLHPNTPSTIDSYLRDRWLPTVTERIMEKDGWAYYHYGNVPRRGERGWYTFDHRPRFNNNYAGLRNRFAILSEAYAYLSFEDRVISSRRFVEEILDFAHDNARVIRSMVEDADRVNVQGSQLALSARPKKSTAPVDILMGEVATERNAYSGARYFARLDTTYVESMYEYIAFEPSESRAAPDAYVVSPDEPTVINRLRDHGVSMRTLSADTVMAVSRFRIDSVQVAPREYQGHREQKVFGSWVASEFTAPAGSAVVRLDQALGRLAFSLLEPQSDDGFANWAIIDLSDGATEWYPVVAIE